MSSTLTSLGDMRDGEAMEIAISDAEKKARAFRKQAEDALAEAEKWEGVAAQMRAARELSRLPAGRAPVIPAKAPEKQKRRPRGFWTEEIKKVVVELGDHNGRGPSKRMVIEAILKKFSDAARPTLWSAVNVLIEKGELKFVGPDCLYLPGQVPQAVSA